MTLLNRLLAIACVAGVSCVVTAQSGTLDQSFNAGDAGFGLGDGARNWVTHILVQPDDKVIIIGSFTNYNGTPRAGIARLLPDGTLDTSFDVGEGVRMANLTSTQPRSAALLSDGKLVIGGDFAFFNGQPADKVAILNTDGSLFNAIPAGEGPNAWVRSIAAEGNTGNFVIAGTFDSVGVVVRNDLARLNANDLTAQPSFDPGAGVGTGSIQTLIAQPDGKILIGGSFSMFDGTAQNNLARIDGTGALDVTFQIGSGPNSAVSCIALQPDGKIIIGGGWSEYDDVSREGIARLNTDGSLDTGFDPGNAIGDNFYYHINQCAVMPNGNVMVVGFFQTFDGAFSKCIVQLNSDGSVAITYPNLLVNYEEIYTLAVRADSRALIDTHNQLFDSSGRGNFLQLNSDGTVDTDFNPGTGFNSVVEDVAIGSDGRVVATGFFTLFANTAQSSVAVLDQDGTLDPTCTIAPFFTGYNDFQARTCAIQDDGKILIGGAFGNSNNAPGQGIARYNADGSIDQDFTTGNGLEGVNASAMSVVLQPDDKILVGGHFTSFNGTPRARILRLLPNGVLDDTFDPGTGPNADANGIALQADGRLLIWGYFSEVNGVARSRVARLNTDGSLDLAFDPGTGPDGMVSVVIPQPDGKVIMGGSFQNFNGVPAPFLVRLNNDGSLDTSFDPGGSGPNGAVQCGLVLPNGMLVLAGAFTTYNGNTQNHLARIHPGGALDPAFDPGTGAEDIRTLALQPDGNIIAGGNFTSYNGIGRNRIVRILTDFSTAIPEPGSLDLQVLPNPTNGPASLSTTIKGPVDVIITDAIGKIVYTGKRPMTNVPMIKLDLSDEAPGLYLVHVSGQGTSIAARLVKE